MQISRIKAKKLFSKHLFLICFKIFAKNDLNVYDKEY